MFYLGLGVGLFVGVIIGIFVAALCVAANKNDK